MIKLPNVITKALAVDTNAYAANDLVGAKLELDLSIFRNVDQLLLNTAIITDKSDQAATFNLILFDQDPSNTTFTDNGALDIHDSDVSKVFAVVSIATELDLGGSRVRTHGPTNQMSIPLPLNETDASNKIYACLQLASGTPTFAAADLTLRLGLQHTRGN